jgi:hypothetical protein
MQTNIEKLCDEINALRADDPQIFEAFISQNPGEQRIDLDFFMDGYYDGYIDFEKIDPYDPIGAPGTTSDVYAGASLHIRVYDREEPVPWTREDLLSSVPLNVYFLLNAAARAGKISSKILAEWPITPEQRKDRARAQALALQDHEQALEQFISDQDPKTAAALRSLNNEARERQRKK